MKKPFLLENDTVLFVDCDDTLVMWSWPPEAEKELIHISAKNEPALQNILVWPHKYHIEKIKRFKLRGLSVVVWSQGGYAWANAIVEALGLTEFVDAVMAKPRWVVDDLPINAWLNDSQREYYDPKTGKILFGNYQDVTSENSHSGTS